MIDEMCVAEVQWLPNFAQEISNARSRLEEAERSGIYVWLVETQGAARLKIRTVKEMATVWEEATAMADVAVKAK